MSQYLAEISWGSISKNVNVYYSGGVFQIHEYTLEVYPLDVNEPGADDLSSLAVGDYFIDYIGYPWEILEITTISSGLKLRVYDVVERSLSEVLNYGPYPNEIGYVYRPIAGKLLLSQAQLLKLDSQARDRINNIEKAIAGGGGVNDHNFLLNIGINTHDEIDTHIGDLNNPHQTDLTGIGESYESINYWTKTGNNLKYDSGVVEVFRSNDLYSFISKISTEAGGSQSWIGIAPTKIQFRRAESDGVNFILESSTLIGGAGGNILFKPNSDALNYTPVERMRISKDGKISFGEGAAGFKFPTSDGVSNQVLSTNGSGNLFWSGKSELNYWKEEIENDLLSYTGGIDLYGATGGLINCKSPSQFSGITYLTSEGSNRYGLLFDSTNDIVVLGNRAANGSVQIRANNSTGGISGEETVANFEHNLISFNKEAFFNELIQTNTHGSSLEWNNAYTHSTISGNPHNTSPDSIMTGRYLDQSGNILGTAKSNSIRLSQNNSGSTGFPEELGVSWFFDYTDGRNFALWASKNTEGLWYQSYNELLVNQGWKQIADRAWVGSQGYLTSEVDTLSSVMARSNLFSTQLKYTPTLGTILETSSKAAIYKTTTNGGLAIGVDDSLILGAGEATLSMRSNVSLSDEAVNIGGESGVKFYSFPNNDVTWSNRHEMVFDNAGTLTVPASVTAPLFTGKATQVNVADHSTNDTEYPVVWNNYNNSLFDTVSKFTFNPNLGRLSISGDLLAGSFKKTGGTSSQFLKADGSIDGSKYVPYKVVTPTVTTTFTPVTGTKDGQYNVTTTTTGTLTVANPDTGSSAGPPSDGDTLIFRIHTGSIARTLSFGTIYNFKAPEPSSTIANDDLYIGCTYNSRTTKWDVLSVI